MRWYIQGIVYLLAVIGVPSRYLGGWKWKHRMPPEPLEFAEPPRREAYMSMQKGVGYCENLACNDYAKGVFLLNHGDTFYCPLCRDLGHMEPERGLYSGDSQIWKEVRVEFNFDPLSRTYREIGIVRDDSLEDVGNIYTLQTPLVKTDRRALKIAEALLANLNRYPGMLDPNGIPQTTEVVLSFDDDPREFSHKLHQLAQQWEKANQAEKKIREEACAR